MHCRRVGEPGRQRVRRTSSAVPRDPCRRTCAGIRRRKPTLWPGRPAIRDTKSYGEDCHQMRNSELLLWIDARPKHWRRDLKLVLGVAAAGLTLATAFALSARLWWAFDLFSHFRLQYAILAAALCLGALALRAWPIAA